MLIASSAHAAPSIELEIATERGLQITAPREWLQLLTRIGLDNVRIRAAQAGELPKVTNRGTDERPSYHVVGVLTAGEQLRLPGGTFGRGDMTRLKDYFDRLAADGNERLTAPRGHFGLTEKELTAVLADLSQPIDFETKGQQARAVVERLAAKFALKLAIDAAADRAIDESKPVADELKGIAAGTGLALALRASGLVLRPEKTRGQPIAYRIAASDAGGAAAPGPGRRAASAARAGKISDLEMKDWPLGWETEKAPGEIAPSL
ncbi:MAG TPA: hypothetical protein VH835_00010, partial [Dongiaceae bacterium]